MARAEKRKGFVLYFDQIEQVSMLSDEEAGQVFKTLFQCNSEKKPHTCFKNSLTEMCFSVIYSQMRRDAEKYEQKCERLSQNAKQRWEESEDGQDADAIACNTKTKKEKKKKTNIDIATDGVTGKDTDAAHPRNAGSATPSTAVAAAEGTEGKDLFWLGEEQEEIDCAIAKGVPPTYVQVRIDRARGYAMERGRPLSTVLCDWWLRDKQTPTWKREERLLRTDAARARVRAEVEAEEGEWQSLLQSHQDRLDRL